ncbi:MAG: lipid-binding SYLF domain-containing protein [Bacteroidota bacterium]
MKKLTLIVAMVCVIGHAYAQIGKSQDEKANSTLEKATIAFEDLIESPDVGVPKSLLEKMEGIVVFPKALKVALGVGGQGGRGFAMIKKEDGKWSNPFFISMGEGSVGAQIGVQSSDIVLIFKRRENIIKLENTELTLGGDVGIAAGPVGRNSSVNTDIGFDAEIYSYSRSKGLYAGISLEGTVLESNDKVNKAFYDKNSITIKDIFFDTKTPYNDKVAAFIKMLVKATR